MDLGHPIELPRSARRTWDAAWRSAVRREEIARGLRRALIRADVKGAFAGECLRALMPRVGGEVAHLSALARQWRRELGLLAMGLLVLAGAFVQAVASRQLGRVAGSDVAVTVTLTIAIGTLAGFVRAERDRRRRTAEVRRQLEDALEGLLPPLLRRRLNDALRVAFATLDVREANGLAETVDPSLEVATSARSALTALMARMGSGAIGISGARGAGKSTLIRAACGGRLTPPGRSPAVGVSVSAPVRWEASEFVPLLFAELCAAVAPELAEPGRARRRAVDVVRLSLASVVVTVLLYLAAGVAFGGVAIRGEHLEALAFAFVAVLLALAAQPLLDRVVLPAETASLERVAARRLQELRFRETVVRGWTVGARSLLGIGIGVDRKRELSATRQPLTLPEVVASYKQFVRRVAEEHTLVIGIDELDKMASAEEAARFLSDVKVLFGEQPCFYLVSVSDDAMSEFERRGVPLRTVFDSTFDDVLHVETLSFEESRAIVNGRVVGMGDGYIALCHMLGDGIPRELIRYVRGAVEASERGARTPGAVARVLVADRQERIERAATSAAMRLLGGGGDHLLVEWLESLPAPAVETLPMRWNVAALLARLGEAAADAEVRAAEQGLVLELAAIAYRAATVVALADVLDADGLEATVREHEPAQVLSLLARAGRDLRHGPRTAWRAVDAARDEIGLARAPFPLDVPGPTVRPERSERVRGRIARALVTLLR